MTADRFGAVPSGEYTSLVSIREDLAAHASAARADPGPRHDGQEPGPVGPSGASGGPAVGSPDQPPGRPGLGTEPSAPTATGRPGGRSRSRSWLPALPPQHGAWAFLIVPVLCGFAVAGTSPAGWLLLPAWVCAYPVGYYFGRALTVRVRRGSWSRLARRERSRALPWAVLTAVLGLPLALSRPWLLLVAGLLAVLWGFGLWVAARRGERSLANDLMLVAQAAVALPLTVAVVAGPGALSGGLAAPTIQATAVVAAYLAGSVLHVKSLLREAGNVSYRRANVSWHGALAVGSALVNPWWLVGTLPALLRAILLRPGMRPGAIGGVETVVAVLVVVAALAAL